MRADAWIVDFLIKKGVTDIFGIPGVVIMDFLYAIDSRKPEITPHLCYHEQGGAYEACGYAQSTGKLGVAYSTRGPGFTNMLTAIADAYYDSIPVMFFSAHANTEINRNMRVLNNQEIDTVGIAKHVTKYAVRIDNVADLQHEVIRAYQHATSGRKGPVFLDICSSVFAQDIEETDNTIILYSNKYDDEGPQAAKEVVKRIKKSSRPVFLIGNGVRDDDSVRILKSLAKEYEIPILSSRGGQDVVPDVDEYFGFVGSRATRHSNFIISKADFIVAVGNRLSFPTKSKSFRPIVEKSFTVRIEADRAELERDIPNSIGYVAEALSFFRALQNENLKYSGSREWIDVCRKLRATLQGWDEIPVIAKIRQIIEKSGCGSVLSCDVGNHSFWVTSAHAYSGCSNRILYSGSFGALGCALPKAIGAHYSTRKPSVCFVGDQGMQFNMQEMQLIAQNHLPITVIVLNNQSSGMIMEREKARYGDHYLHTTTDSGYSFPSYKAIAEVYGFEYHCIDAMNADLKIDFQFGTGPMLMEFMVDDDTVLYPTLPQGNPCQDLAPALPRDIYELLDKL